MKLPDKLGYKALYGLGVVTSFCAPVTTGYVIWRGLVNEKDFHPIVALVGAAAVEGMGFMAANMGLAHYGVDTKNGRRYGSLSTWLSVLALFAYVGVAMVLTWAIESDPVLALFPLLSVIGALLLALAQELDRRETVTEQDAERTTQEVAERMRLDAERQAERDRLAAERQARLDHLAHEEKLEQIRARKDTRIARLQAVTGNVTGDKSGVTGDVTPTVTSNERRERLQAMIATGDKLNVTELSQQWGVSRKTLYGDIAHVTGKNGNGNV